MDIIEGPVTELSFSSGIMEYRKTEEWFVFHKKYSTDRQRKGDSSMEILRCEGVRKVYGLGGSQVTALDGIDLSIEKGEFVAVVGASGSGKSTLLHILGSVDRPTDGKVIVDGMDLSGLNQDRKSVV